MAYFSIEAALLGVEVSQGEADEVAQSPVEPVFYLILSSEIFVEFTC